MLSRLLFSKITFSTLFLSISLGLVCYPSAQAQSTTPNATTENANGGATIDADDSPLEDGGDLEDVGGLEDAEEASELETQNTAPEAPSDVDSTASENEEEVLDSSGESDVQTTQSDEVSYEALEGFLNEKDWERADRETFNLLLALVGNKSKQKGYFLLPEWKAFVDNNESCADIQRIDELWKEASEESLGFSVQKRLYEQVFNSSLIQNKVLAFYHKIGWLEPDFSAVSVAWERSVENNIVRYLEDQKPDFKDPIPGHLPALMSWEDDRDRRLYLFNKCGL